MVYLDNKAYYTIKKLILKVAILAVFSKGVTHDWGQKLEITPSFVLGQK